MIYVFIGIAALIVYIVGKSFADLRKNEANKKATAARFEKYKNNRNLNITADKNIDMLIDFSTLMTKHIQNNLDIDSPLIFYEQVYFLYFLKDMYAVGKNKSVTDRHTALKCLIETLNYKHKLDYLDNKDDFKNTFTKRYAGYMYILLNDNYNFSENFFNDVFEYQTAQIMSIKTKNSFSSFSPEGNCLENTKEELNIKSIVSENYSLIDSFMAQQ